MWFHLVCFLSVICFKNVWIISTHSSLRSIIEFPWNDAMMHSNQHSLCEYDENACKVTVYFNSYNPFSGHVHKHQQTKFLTLRLFLLSLQRHRFCCNWFYIDFQLKRELSLSCHCAFVCLPQTFHIHCTRDNCW